MRGSAPTGNTSSSAFCFDRSPTNAELSAFMKKVWNGWFVKWRDKSSTMSDFEWSICLDEADAVIYPYQDCPVAVNITRQLIFELERRRRHAAEDADGAEAAAV